MDNFMTAVCVCVAAKRKSVLTSSQRDLYQRSLKLLQTIGNEILDEFQAKENYRQAKEKLDVLESMYPQFKETK
jgi:hypothetical protein